MIFTNRVGMLALLIVSLHLCEFIQTLCQIDFAITLLQTQIIANIVQFAFILFTMAKEEKVVERNLTMTFLLHLHHQVKEERGRGLPLSLQSLQGSSTVDSGLDIDYHHYSDYHQHFHFQFESTQGCKSWDSKSLFSPFEEKPVQLVRFPRLPPQPLRLQQNILGFTVAQSLE